MTLKTSVGRREGGHSRRKENEEIQKPNVMCTSCLDSDLNELIVTYEEE